MGFAFLALLSLGMITWAIISVEQKVAAGKFNNATLYSFVIFCSLFLFILASVCINLRSIYVSESSVNYNYFLFPFGKRVLKTSKLDGYTIVKEKRKAFGGPSDAPVFMSLSDTEAIWLFEKGKLKLRISSMLYTNYDEVKSEMMNLNRIEVDTTSSLSQLLFMLRLKRLSK